jgi:integrase
MSDHSRIPSYRRHKQSGQAVVTLSDGMGSRRDVLLGKFGTVGSRAEYARVIAEWEAAGRRLPQSASTKNDITLNEMALAHWKFAQDYHGFDGTRTGHCLKDTLRIVKQLYGHTRALDFGPLALKACRQQMIEKGWSRTYINAQVGRIRRMFRWAAEEELLPASVYQNLRAVTGLRLGKTTARETRKVKPVSAERVNATLPHLPLVVRAMVCLQQLTGCRPAEVCLIRPLDLDMSNPACWVYQPPRHKTQHHDMSRHVLIGPKAQEVLRPYLGTRLDVYCFSPAASEALRSDQRRQQRQTPMTPSQQEREMKARRKRRLRGPRDHYDTTSYRNAILRASDRAFPLPEHLAPRQLENGKRESCSAWRARLTEADWAEIRAWRKAHHWHPNQLRHSRATEIRRYGLDMVKTVLGHAKVETSQIYSEKDMAAAMELVAKIG